MATSAIDFSDLGGQRVQPSAAQTIDFSDLGGQRVSASSPATPVAEMRQAPSGVRGWLQDLEGDVRYGSKSTLPGRVLHAMGAHGINVGAQASAGDYIESPILGTIHAAQGVAMTPEHPVRGPLKTLGGLLEASQIPASFMAPEVAEGAAQVAGGAAQVPGKIAGIVTGRAAKTAGGELFNTVSKAASDANLTVDANAAFDAAQKIAENADQAGRNVLGIRKFMNRVTDPDKGPLTYEEARGFYKNIGDLSVSEKNALNKPTKRLVVGFLKELDTGIRGAAESIGQGENYSKAMELYHTGAQRADFVSDTLTPLAKSAAKGAVKGGAWGVTATGAGLGLYDLLKSH